MNRLKLLVPAALFFLLIAASITVFTITTDNADRKPASRPQIPKRIVSLVPGNTEILFALGLEDRIVGVTNYCDYPPAARKKAKVGDMNTNLEKVVALKPDLVVAHALLNDHLTKRMKSLGIKVVAIDPKNFSQLYSDIRKVGQLTGTKARAEAIVRKMAADVSAVKSRTARLRSKKVLVVVQPNPLWAAGPESFTDEMLAYSHAENIAHDARPGFNQFAVEVAVTRNPDIIIVSRKEDRDFIVKSSLWKRTNAVKRGAVYVVDGDLLFRAGPRLSQGLAQMARAIHPEAMK